MRTFESAPQPVGELRKILVDFTGDLDAGVTLNSLVATQSVYSGTTSTVTLGAPVVTGPRATVGVLGGSAGTIYQLTFTAALSDGQALIKHTLLAVVPDAV